MSYPDRCLVGADELRDALRFSNTSDDTTLALLADRVMGILEELCERDLVTRQPSDGSKVYAEWHDLSVPQGYVDLRHRPVRAIQKLQTGLPTTLFTFDAVDYVFDSERGMLMLKRGAVNPGAWRPPGFIDFPEDYYVRGLGVKTGAGFNPGVGTVYVEYSGGYDPFAGPPTGLDPLPAPGILRAAFIDVASRIYRAEENKSQGLAQTIGQGVAITTKFNQDYASPEVREYLNRQRYFGKTARRSVAFVNKV